MLGPNITGLISSIVGNVGGAFYMGDNIIYKIGANDEYGCANKNFDASRSNSIYTDSGKVYPLSLALNFIIKA